MKRLLPMKTLVPACLLAAACLISLSPWAAGQGRDVKDAKDATVFPTAIFTFEERGAGVKEFGLKVTDILFARLVAKPELMLVDRVEMKKTLDEQAINISGAVKADEAAKVGQLTGAKLLVTGSVLQVDKKIYLVAKVIGTETSRVVGASVDGKASDDLAPLVEKLADSLAETIAKQADKLVAKKVEVKDRIAALNEKLKKATRPTVFVAIPEFHVGKAVVDPAAQTELIRFLKGTGFDVIDTEEGTVGKADVVITGESISETAGRVGELISVRGRVELKAVDRKTGKVLVADRQTTRVVDLTDVIGGKTALQQAAATLAERLLPQLVRK